MNLEREFEALLAILGKMRDQYVSYKDLLLKQREAIIANKLEDLTEILSKIELVNESISRLEERRIFATDTLAMNTKEEIKTIRDIIKAFPEYNAAKLESLSLELKKTANEIKNYSASNAELLEISRSIVRETMKTIMTQDVDPRDRAWRTYGNSGGYSRTVRREPVHLVNKRG
jgi:hypothetical protein